MITSRSTAIKWAQNLLATDNWLLLDTETTGFSKSAEIVEIGTVVSPKAECCPGQWSSLVKPLQPIPEEVIKVHGITNEKVANAPSFIEVYPVLERTFSRYTRILIYNAKYDTRILQQCCALNGLPPFQYKQVECVMLAYQAFMGSRKPLPLPNSVHGAIGDCMATLDLIKVMAAG